MRNTDKAWQKFGQFDPYFAVLSHPRFRAAAKDGETRRMILHAMLRRLSDNGVGALHFTYAIHAHGWKRLLRELRATFLLVNGLAKRPSPWSTFVNGNSFRSPYIETRSYNVNRLLLRLQEQGCHHVHLRFSDHCLYKGIFLLIKKEPLPLS